MSDAGPAPGLRRDLGTLESYAALVGVLVGAGIFKVTSQAWSLTGPSVILAHLVLAVPVLATSVAYCVFLSTPLGRLPGGEYTHISRTFGGYGVAFVGVWLKVIGYLGALAFLAVAFADYVVELAPARLSATHRLPLALGSLVFFWIVHVMGVRWFGRLQVAMFLLLGVSLLVLVVPGLFAIQLAHYQPFFSHGAGGFAACLPPLFFAYAGFESLAQAAGEVRDSTERLPRVFINGILATTALYLLMSVVAFGVLPGTLLQASVAPMADVSSVYLPRGGTWLVTLGAVMAFATSLNATMLVPSRVAVMLARDGLAPAWLGRIEPRTGTPVVGLTLTLVAPTLLLLSGQISLALNIAVMALVLLYGLHSAALLLLPRANPGLFGSISVRVPLTLQRAAAILSILSMAGLVFVQARQDLQTLTETRLAERIAGHSLTTLELVVLWGLLGVVVYGLRRGQASFAAIDAAQASVLSGRSGE